MRKPRTLAGAWKEMRETWQRQKKESGYQFDTPLPEPKDRGKAKDALGASLGDLAPTGLS